MIINYYTNAAHPKFELFIKRWNKYIHILEENAKKE
ncbi:MAG: hypothetical protein K0S23_1064 [Fluviicola sp.]|jgi:hypothetical protein|nr:hypothetical protein [Fluviicola sp.]